MIPREKVTTFARRNAETGSCVCLIVERMAAPSLPLLNTLLGHKYLKSLRSTQGSNLFSTTNTLQSSQ